MDRQTGLLLILGGLGLFALASTASGANAWQSSVDPVPPMFPSPDPETVDAIAADIMDAPNPEARIAALLAVIRQLESHNDYAIVYIDPRNGAPAKYPTGHFSDFSRFPFDASNEGALISIGEFAGQHSTASGAYQINLPTYREFAPRLGITDFSPASQDALGLAILKKTGAYDASISGDIAPAFQLASTRWASLPGSTAGQRPKSLTVAQNLFDQFLTSA
jgi:lysozyme